MTSFYQHTPHLLYFSLHCELFPSQWIYLRSPNPRRYPQLSQFPLQFNLLWSTVNRTATCKTLFVSGLISTRRTEIAFNPFWFAFSFLLADSRIVLIHNSLGIQRIKIVWSKSNLLLLLLLCRFLSVWRILEEVLWTLISTIQLLLLPVFNVLFNSRKFL